MSSTKSVSEGGRFCCRGFGVSQPPRRMLRLMTPMNAQSDDQWARCGNPAIMREAEYRNSQAVCQGKHDNARVHKTNAGVSKEEDVD